MLGMGYLLVQKELVQAKESRSLSVICIYIVLPCVILRSFQIDFTSEVRDGFLLAVLAAVLIHLILFSSVAILAKIFHLNNVEKASLIYSNAGNLIIPLVMAVLGDKWIIYASAFLVVQNLFVWTHCVHLVSGLKQLEVKKILTNINMIAVFAGVLFLIFHIQLPKLLTETLSQTAALIGPLSMIMIGMMLGTTKWKSVFLDKRLYLITILKMIVLPLIILVFLKYFRLDHFTANGKEILMISLMAVITPAATTVTQLAQLYQNHPQEASFINIMTTIFCIITMPLVIFLYTL